MPKLIDLSQEIYQGMGVFPGHLKTVVFDHMTHEDTAEVFENDLTYATKGMILNDNGPTHVDSFSHLDPDGDPIAAMPLELFYGPALCIDVSHVDPSDHVERDDLDRALAATGLAISPGDILLIRTGHHDRFGDTPQYPKGYTGLSADAGEWIREAGVRVFGVDNPSPDHPRSRTYPIHVMCRDHKMTHYENLCNLGAVVGQRFTFVGFPLKLRLGHGGPTRAVAILDGGQ